MSNSKTTLKSEIGLVPWWGYLFAALSVAIIAPVVYIHLLEGLPRSTGFLVAPFVALTASCVMAAFIMLIGYVNRDAKRRSMNSTLWTLVVIFVPDAIGFILYFLLRKPAAIPCPGCGTPANPNFNFCPKCKFNLRPTCPGCQHAINPGDAYCPYCSQELKTAAAG